MPIFYAFHSIRYSVFAPSTLAEKTVGAVGCTILVWLVYGIVCLLAKPIADTTKHSSNDKPDIVLSKNQPNAVCQKNQSIKSKKWLVIALVSTAVLAAISLGGFFIIKNKLSTYLENLVEKNPLHFAAAIGNLEKVDLLISQGANPNAKSLASLAGHTPLIAATRGHYDLIAEHLLIAGANPNQRDKFGWAALHHAITPSDGADLDIITILVKHGADVNIQDNSLRTPLHRAAQYGQLQAVLLLLKYGADPNIKDHFGWTPADRAVAYPDIQSILISYKSDKGSGVSKLLEFPAFFSEKHSFKAKFPGKVKVTDYWLATHYTVEIEGEGAYNIIVNPFPKPVLSDKAIQAALEGQLQGRLALFGDDADLLESRYIVFTGRKALQYEYTVESQGTLAYFKGVCFIVGKFGYGVSCVCTEETKPLVYSKYKDFAKSFHLVGNGQR
jgi:hypothetical protein